MAEPKKSFPMLPVGHWWALRKKFKQSIPGVVTDNYLSTVLNMTVDSARANVLPFLKVLGIIDEDGKTKERAKQWRDDHHYPEVCKAIATEIYPNDLLDSVTSADDKAAAKRWFANHTGAGDSACGRMASLYSVLIAADPASQPEGQNTKTKEKPLKKVSAKNTEGTSTPPSPSPAPAPTLAPKSKGPEINLNLQIHISADASPDQIEQIFSAMAKHIYRSE